MKFVSPYRKSDLIIFTALIFTAILPVVVYEEIGAYDQNAKMVIARKAILQTLGIASLSISPECTATRDMTEGICGCLGDAPGGYCFHSTCEVVDLPKFQDQLKFTIQVMRRK